MGYKLQTANGLTPPRYVHETLEGAIAEAKRLNLQCGYKVEILEIVGCVEQVEVPVVERKQVVKSFKADSDLPF